MTWLLPPQNLSTWTWTQPPPTIVSLSVLTIVWLELGCVDSVEYRGLNRETPNNGVVSALTVTAEVGETCTCLIRRVEHGRRASFNVTLTLRRLLHMTVLVIDLLGIMQIRRRVQKTKEKGLFFLLIDRWLRFAVLYCIINRIVCYDHLFIPCEYHSLSPYPTETIVTPIGLLQCCNRDSGLRSSDCGLIRHRLVSGQAPSNTLTILHFRRWWWWN